MAETKNKQDFVYDVISANQFDADMGYSMVGFSTNVTVINQNYFNLEEINLKLESLSRSICIAHLR